MRSGIQLLLFFGSGLFAIPCTGQADLCTGATTITCGAVVNGTTVGYLADVAPVCGTTDGTGGGVWFRFVGTGVNTTASLCGSMFDTKIRVYTGTCGALVCTIGNDDFCGLQSQVTWNATLGVNYYILVHGFGVASGAYTLTLTCATPPVPMCYSMTTTPYLADPYAGTALFLTDDVHSPVVPIGFNFCYNGTSYNQCVISSNNYVSFDLARANTYSPWVTVAVPSATPLEVSRSILNPWQDIHPGVGGSIFYQTLGTAPNRRFVVSYLNVPMFSCTSQLYTSQTVLYEGSNCIGSYILSKPICATWNSGNAVHALHNTGGTSATVVAGRNNTQWSVAAQGMFFVPTCAPCSTATTAACLSVVLPIELLHFRGRNEGTVNQLEWATASEQNVDHFTVERSRDGEDFHPIGTVDATGNSQSLIEYRLTDAQPACGVNYYRLRSTDIDGTGVLSDVVLVECRPQGVAAIRPNPATGISWITLPEDIHLPAGLVIRDLTGRILTRTTVTTRDTPFNMSGLSTGTYTLEVTGSGGPAIRFMVE